MVIVSSDSSTWTLPVLDTYPAPSVVGAGVLHCHGHKTLRSALPSSVGPGSSYREDRLTLIPTIGAWQVSVSRPLVVSLAGSHLYAGAGLIVGGTQRHALKLLAAAPARACTHAFVDRKDSNGSQPAAFGTSPRDVSAATVRGLRSRS